MKKHLIIESSLAVFLTVTILLSSCCINPGDIFKTKYKKIEYVSTPLDGVTKLEIETNVGAITIKGADVTDCNITAKFIIKARSKEKARELAEQVNILLEHTADKLKIRSDKPESLSGSNFSAEFTVTVPKHLNLNCDAHVGSIKISKIQGQIKASTKVGSITCDSVAADVELNTNVGSINVTYLDTSPAACNADLTTNVGSIDFTAPAELSAEIDASTNVGSISTAKPLTVVGRIGKKVKGTIGSGQGKIRLRTNVGSIKIK